MKYLADETPRFCSVLSGSTLFVNVLFVDPMFQCIYPVPQVRILNSKLATPLSSIPNLKAYAPSTESLRLAKLVNISLYIYNKMLVKKWLNH